MEISDNIVEYEVEKWTLKREAIANGHPRQHLYKSTHKAQPTVFIGFTSLI